MNVLAITVNEKGILRIDILVANQKDYSEALEFHRKIAPEIAKFDKAIKSKMMDSSQLK
jgi:hypothetical protein